MPNARKGVVNTLIIGTKKSGYKLYLRVGGQVFEVSAGVNPADKSEKEWFKAQLDKAINRIRSDARRVQTMQENKAA